MAKGETGQLAASSLQSKAAKAAPAHAAARRRSSTLRRWASVATSKWAWSAVVIVAVYLGFFYRPRLLRYTFEIAGGPGLNPEFPSPSRHFRVVVRNAKGHQEVPSGFKANNIRLSWQTVPHIPGQSGPPVGYEVYDIGNGEYEVAYRVREGIPSGHELRLRVTYGGRRTNFAIEPVEVSIQGPLHEPSCFDPVNSSTWTKAMGCPRSFPQLEEDLENFVTIDLAKLRAAIPKLLEKSSATSFLHYVIKDNQIFRKVHGPFPAFSYFSDMILHQLSATVKLPDVEFVMNVGDWPLVAKSWGDSRVPVFSWCGSTDSFDIVLPQWDVTRSTVLGNAASSPDLLASQGWGTRKWNTKDPRAAFRGRDSNPVRVQLAQLSSKHPDVLDVAITSWENDENFEVEEQLGRKGSLQLQEFPKYKYILLLDGTVAAYRNPYLIASGSLLLKQESPYYEWYQKELSPWKHFVPFDGTGEDLLSKLQWAKEHDEEAQRIAANARDYARQNLLPERVLCFYYQALHAYASRQKGTPAVTEDMIWVPLPHRPKRNTCGSPDVLTRLGSYPIIPLHPTSVESVLFKEDKDAVVIAHSAFCNKSARVLPGIVAMARQYKAAGADLLFASAETFSLQYPIKWLHAGSGPKLFFLKAGSATPEQLEGQLTVSAAVSFINSKLSSAQHRITAPPEPEETVSDPIPEKWDGPVKRIVAKNFDERVLNSDKDVLLMVSAPWCGYCKKIKPAFFRFARSVAASSAAATVLDVAKMNGPTNEIRHPEFPVPHYPTIWFIRKGETKPIIFSGSATEEKLLSFSKQHATKPESLEGVVVQAPDLRTSSLPLMKDTQQRTGSPILSIDTETFYSGVLDSDKDVLLLVYAPWCGHCKKLEPIYEEFGKLAAESKTASESLVVAKMDGAANRLPDEKYKVTGFPTVWFFKKGSDTPIKFMGERTTKGLASFVQQHATAKVELKVPDSPAVEAVSQPVPTVNDGAVKVVVGDTFKSQVLDAGKDVLLLVYAPWCGHCKKLEPIYEEFGKLAAESKTASESLVVAKMDGAANRLPDEKYKVTGFPTVWFFKKGSDTPIKFMGERTTKGLASFVQQHATAKVELKVPDSPAVEAVSQPVPTVNDGAVKVVVGDTFKSQVLDAGKDVLLLVYAPWCGHCKKLEPIYEEFGKLAAESKTASESLVVAKMDGAANRLPDEKYKVTGFPTVWFFKKGSDTPIKFMGERTTKGLASFVQQHATAKVELKVPDSPAVEAVSQPVPTVNDGAVKVVVGDTFKSQVLDAGKDVLLLVYAPWCGHCKKLEPIYEEFGKLAAESKTASESLVVAKMDGAANRLPDEKYKVTGFPTVWFFKKGSDTPIKFMGERTTKGLASFVQQHATAKVELKVPDSPAVEAVSQPVPTVNDGAVKVVVGDTFKSQVLDAGKDVLLLVYAPWCGHCKKLEPIYEEFGKLAAESKTASESLVVAKMDGAANRLPDEKYKVTGFPTVWFFKKGSDTPIKFMGERTTKGLASFVQQHATAKVELKVPDSPAVEAVSQPVPTVNDGAVKVVVGDTFKSQVLDAGKDVLLLVYAPWCGHCKKLEPIYEEFGKLAAESKTASESLVVAKMDGAANRLPDEKYKVTGFPTVWFFKKGSDTPIKFMGERTTKGLASFVQQHATAKVELKVPDSPAVEAVSQPVPTVNDGAVKVVVGDTFKSQVLDAGKDVLLLVYAPWCGHCKKLEPIYEEFGKLAAESKTASESLVVAKMDGAANRLPDEKYKVTGFPTVWFFKKGSDTPIKFMGERTTKGLASFVQQHATAKVELKVPDSPAVEAVSQPVPTVNDGAVKVVVGDTFKSQVLDAGKDVLLLVYAPWCGHCKKLEPIYEEFGKLAAESKTASESLVVAKMDGAANRLPDEKYKVTGFPTVWFFKKGSDTPIKFMGERTTKGLASFVQQHATAKVELKVPDSPAVEAVSQPVPTVNDGAVKVVVGDTFKSQVLDAGKDVLLLVYAPWCGHCKKLEPIYEEFGKLAAESKTASESLVVAKMDGAANRLPDEKYKVTGFPTVWFFKKGSDTPIKFMGERTTKGLASFVQQHATAKVELKVPDSPAVEAVSQPVPTVNDGAVKVVVGDTFKSQVLDAGKDVLLLVYAPWCGHCKKLEPIYEEFGKLAAESKTASESLVVAKMDGAANRLPDEKYKVTGFPTVWFFKKGSDTPIKFMGERTTKGLASFVQQHATAKVELKVPDSPAVEAVSQPVPTVNDGAVKVVVGDTFKSQVLDAGKDVLLLVYAPWCGHCKKLEPIYEEFGKLAAESKTASESLVVAKMDGAANRLPDEKYKVTGFPTVWFFKKGSDTPIKFMGERTTKGLASFVQQHATAKVELKVPDSPAVEAVSQPVPTVNDGAVKVVVGDTFKSQVLDAGKDVLLLVYAPWCGHCKKLEPIYEEFGKLAAESKTASESLVVAKMDGAANRLPDEKYKVTGFPTVWFFKKGSDTPIKFMGERTTKGLASFVQQQASSRVEISVP